MNTLLTTVTPVYQGEKYLGELVNQLEQIRDILPSKYPGIELIESIFVIDDCKDSSFEVLKTLSKTRNWIQIIELSNNYGQHPATVAGILHSSGDWVFTLDEDTQHRPKFIIPLLKHCLESNCDIVYAQPIHNTHSNFIRDKLSIGFKKFVAFLSSNSSVPIFNSFRCMRGSIARAAAATNGIDTYFDVSLCWFTSKVSSLPINMTDIRNLSNNLSSGYSIWGLIKHGKRLILSSKIKFLRIIILMGFLGFMFSIIYSLYILYQLFIGESISIRGWSSTIISIYFFGGLSCLFLGIILESISDILLKSKGKPAFFVVNRSSDNELKELLQNNESIQN